MNWLLLLAGIACNAGASILVKLAMTPAAGPAAGSPLAALNRWPLWLGLGCYGGAFLLYVAALARLPLHVAHPVLTAGAIATVALVSFLLFGEPFRWTTGAGIVLVIAGVALITARSF